MLAKVPPDGGWGWLIVLSHALNGLSTIPIIQTFGLIFHKDYMAALNMSETYRTIIIDTNLAFGMILGLMNGPLLKSFGYRKVAIVGGLLFAFGIMLMAFARSFTHFIISYGILASIGLSMTMSAYSLAINSYFTKKRGRAMGLALTITGLGPIYMPQLVNILLKIYGIQAAVLLLGAYSLHAVVAAMLLQPIKWHRKSVPLCLETINENPEINPNNEGDDTEDETDIHSSKPEITNYSRKRRPSIKYDAETGSIYGLDTLPRQMSIDGTISCTPTYTDISEKNTSMINLHNGRKYSKHSWRNAAKSTESINLGSSMKIFDESTSLTKKLVYYENDVAKVDKSNNVNQSIIEINSALKEVEKETDGCMIEENSDNDDKKNKSIIYRILRRVADLFDFEILRDPIYLNISLGMSIAFFAEVNFSMLTPSILYEMGMTAAENANTLSIIGAVDLISRGVSPYLGEWLRQPPRMMYMLSLILLMISRLSLIFVSSYNGMITVAIGLGFAKGIRSIYMTLIIPSYVPLQKLPNASSIQMMTYGILLICGGPILGVIRDTSGNYTIVNILINCITAVTITMWTVELIITWRSTRQRSNLPEISS